MKTKKKKIIILSCVIASVILGAIGSFFAFGGISILNGEAVAAVSNGAFDATPTDETPTRTISISDLTMSGSDTLIEVQTNGVTLSNCVINGPQSGNCSSNAILVQNGGHLTLSDTTVSGWNSYVAVFCNGVKGNSSITVESDSIISNNSAGGVENDSGTLTITGGVITGNTATNGGGVYSNATMTMSGGEIYGNTATNGGGVYSTGTVTMSGGIIHDNTATVYGGGVCVAGGSFTMTAGQIYHNSAQNGNEIATNGGSATITGGTISPTAPSGGSFLPDFDANYSQTNENGFDYLLGETVLVPNNSGVAVVFEEEKTE